MTLLCSQAHHRNFRTSASRLQSSHQQQSDLPQSLSGDQKSDCSSNAELRRELDYLPKKDRKAIEKQRQDEILDKQANIVAWILFSGMVGFGLGWYYQTKIGKMEKGRGLHAF